MNNEFIHLWPCAMLTAGLMLVLKCMSADQARDSVEWSIFVSLLDACRPQHSLGACCCCRVCTWPTLPQIAIVLALGTSSVRSAWLFLWSKACLVLLSKVSSRMHL